MAVRMVEIRTYGNEIEAGLALDILVTEGIPAEVRVDGGAAYGAVFGAVRGFRLAVPEEDVDEALELLGDGDDRPPPLRAA